MESLTFKLEEFEGPLDLLLYLGGKNKMNLYDVNIMEFISLEHTPKNILIKAVRNGRPDRQKYQEYLAFAKDWQIRPYLEEELVRIGRIPERAE